jgi:hypothetical protein
MHVVPLAPEHRGAVRVWLEDRGIRCFRVDYLKADSVLDMDALRESVRRTRDTIESAWLRSCARHRCLAYSPGNATITLYRGTGNQIVRRVRDSVQPPEALQLDVGTNAACLKVPFSGVVPTTGATLIRVRGSPPRLAA